MSMTETPIELDREFGEELDRHRAYSALDAVRRTVLELAETLPGRPSHLRVRAGDVTVEAEWPAAVPFPAEPAAAHPLPAGPAPAPAAVPGPPAEQPADSWELCAPTVGAFFSTPEPGAEPFVREGDVVRSGQQVAIVEAMKIMIPVHADRPGRVVRVLKGNGDAVEYGEPLFLVVPVEIAAAEGTRGEGG
jgi:acetyl-CoA carboxylase biotin carboxyl carrier protein